MNVPSTRSQHCLLSFVFIFKDHHHHHHVFMMLIHDAYIYIYIYIKSGRKRLNKERENGDPKGT